MLATIIGSAQPEPLDLDFLLIDIENNPLPGQTVRLIFGEGQDWQGPNAGNRLVTDTNGKAQFTTKAILDKVWQWVPIGFTPFSWPTRTDHLQIAAELASVIPGDSNNKEITLHFLYRMDVYRRKWGQCSTVGFLGMYVPDAGGRFSIGVPRTGLPVPDSGGMVFRGDGYTAADFTLEPAEAPKQGWKLKLAFKRNPEPRRQ
jgi:hypothetical protein